MPDFQQAAKELLSRRSAGVKALRLTDDLQPLSIDDALSIQGEMANLQVVGGWKCLLPPAEGKIIAAPIFNVQQNCKTVTLLEDKGVARVEPEICFVLAKHLPAQKALYTEAQIIDAIGTAHMALELMQSRFADDAQQSFYESLADCMLNQGVFVGPQIDKQTAINVNRIKISVTQGDDVRVLDGQHPNERAIDGLVWLVNYMSQRGTDLAEGAAIITGSFKGIVNMAFDIDTQIAYEGLGEYSVKFERQ